MPQDDCKHFVEKQRFLAELPDEDIEVFRARKRRRLNSEQGESLRTEASTIYSTQELRISENSISAQADGAQELESEHVLDDTATKTSAEIASGQASGNRNQEVNNTSPISGQRDGTIRCSPSPRQMCDKISSEDTLLTHSDMQVNYQDDTNDGSHPCTSNSKKVRSHPRMVKQQHENLLQKIINKPAVNKSNDSISTDITSPSNSTFGDLMKSSSRQRQTLDSKRKMKAEKKAKQESESRLRKKEEEEEKKMTPREYAVKVQKKFIDYLQKVSERDLYLKNKIIFYVGGDFDKASRTTRARMDYLRKKGAIVASVYDKDVVTHIVTECNAATTLKALKLKSLGEIPNHIPTLRWDWVHSKSDENIFLHAAFPSRMDAGPEVAPTKSDKGKSKEVQPSDEFSVIEDFSTVTHEPPSEIRASPQTAEVEQVPSSKLTVMPAKEEALNEFNDICEMLQKGHDNESSENSSSESDEKDSHHKFGTEKSRPAFTCDRLNEDVSSCPNQDIIDKLVALRKINEGKHTKHGDEQHWRLFSYGKSIAALKRYPKRIRSLEEAKSIRGIGVKTALKIMEIIKTGDLKRIETDNTTEVRVANLFKGIYGVGSSTAYMWYDRGCRTLDDIKNRKGGIKLTEVQEIGLDYYEDINTRIPRSEVTEIFNSIKKIALSIDPILFVEVMGSYRRGKATCGDIDILMTRPTYDGKTHKGILGTLLKKLHEQKIITEDLAIPENMEDLELTYRGLCRHGKEGIRRRIDILVVPWQYRGAALLYYTGDDIFNRAMRFKAKKMGYSLSQRGLSAGVLRNQRGKKLVPGKIIASETEEEIFRILEVPWQEPHERVRS